MPEYQIRDLNDAINRLMREKHEWEVQIRDLGGINYLYNKAKLFEDEGEQISDIDDYRYYGRARELPGVKELFEADMSFIPERQRKQEMQKRRLDAWYFGYIPPAQESLLEDFEAKIEEQQHKHLENLGDEVEQDWKPLVIEQIPTRDDVEAILLERRKNALLSRIS